MKVDSREETAGEYVLSFNSTQNHLTDFLFSLYFLLSTIHLLYFCLHLKVEQ